MEIRTGTILTCSDDMNQELFLMRGGGRPKFLLSPRPAREDPRVPCCSSLGREATSYGRIDSTESSADRMGGSGGQRGFYSFGCSVLTASLTMGPLPLETVCP